MLFQKAFKTVKFCKKRTMIFFFDNQQISVLVTSIKPVSELEKSWPSPVERQIFMFCSMIFSKDIRKK